MSESGKVYAAISLVMGDLAEVGIEKTRNSSQHGKYRGIDDVYNALGPILSRRGLLIIPQLQDHTAEEKKTKSGHATYHHTVTVDYLLICTEDGSQITVVGWKAEALDMADKGIAKAMSYAYKYMVIELFAIPVEAMPDTDDHSPPEMVPADDVLDRSMLIKLIQEATSDEVLHDLALRFVALDMPIADRQEVAGWLVEKRETAAPGSEAVNKMRAVFVDRGWLASEEQDE